MEKILILGACGQVGSELTLALRKAFGTDNVVASDLNKPKGDLAEGPFEILDATDKAALLSVVQKHSITQVYHLVAMLSAKAEENPVFGWDLNMTSLFHVLDLAKERFINKIFWPSSIAVFGPNTPADNTPQHTTMDPNTVYGISKQAGERWCEYYHEKYKVDVRSVRYPGLIGYKTLPGGGTTDYAVDIYHKAVQSAPFKCFLSQNTKLPMMYMDDAISATIDIMQVPKDKVKIRSSYNIAGMSFSPKELHESIQATYPDFEISYKPDFRQAIADSWPQSIDDGFARKDWGWSPKYDLNKMTQTMLNNLKKLLEKVE